MHSFKRKWASRILAGALLLLLTISVSFAATGCSLDKGDDKSANPVVMRTDDVELTLYDFRQAYYGSQYYQYYYYGMMSAEDYCNAIIDELSVFMYVYNAALDAGVTLSPEQEAEFEAEYNFQLDSVLKQYEGSVDATITDAEQKRAEAKKLLENDLQKDGFTYDQFVELSKNNLYMYKLASIYNEQLRSATSVTDEDVTNYVSEQLNASDSLTMGDYMEQLESYNNAAGPSPVYVPEDCFSVNHILLLFETESTDSGSINYLTDSREEDVNNLEQLLAVTNGFSGFIELEETYGDDPGMDDPVYIENGYLVHADYEESYYDGFVYASMNLYYDEWTPEPKENETEPYTPPELEFFTMLDGTRIVKVATDIGIHYIIVNKEYKRGEVEYVKGDAVWESWKTAVTDKKFSDAFDGMLAQWKLNYSIEVLKDIFWSEFVPDATTASQS